MPRRNRIVVPGLPHHITQRGNGRHSIFDSDGDRRVFLALLGRYATAYGMSIWGYCLMSNHFHLIVVPERADSAAKALGSLLANYARYLNVRRESCGHLWQARYYSVPMEPVYCWKALAYVEHNPVRAGMIETAERYRWSSAAARLGGVRGTGVAGSRSLAGGMDPGRMETVAGRPQGGSRDRKRTARGHAQRLSIGASLGRKAGAGTRQETPPR